MFLVFMYNQTDWQILQLKTSTNKLACIKTLFYGSKLPFNLPNLNQQTVKRSWTGWKTNYRVFLLTCLTVSHFGHSIKSLFKSAEIKDPFFKTANQARIQNPPPFRGKTGLLFFSFLVTNDLSPTFWWTISGLIWSKDVTVASRLTCLRAYKRRCDGHEISVSDKPAASLFAGCSRLILIDRLEDDPFLSLSSLPPVVPNSVSKGRILISFSDNR